jgi:hypothetical protein
MAIARYREFGVPVYWIQDSGVVGSIKKASVGLARKYMQRVARELDQYTTVDAAGEKEPIHDFLLLQGVRFAFRVHQVRGMTAACSAQLRGGDGKSMCIFVVKSLETR